MCIYIPNVFAIMDTCQSLHILDFVLSQSVSFKSYKPFLRFSNGLERFAHGRMVRNEMELIYTDAKKEFRIKPCCYHFV